MCKVMMFTNGAKIQNVERLVNVVSRFLQASEKDGFGWAAYGVEGIFGEKTTRPSHSFRMNKFNMQLPFIEPTYEKFGQLEQVVGPIILHGRTSTNDKTLVNTHPLMNEDYALIHNGVVQNSGPDYVRRTTNDTEHLLHWLTMEGISGIEKNVSGYYAVGAIDKEGLLHVVRDDRAQLSVAWISTIESFLFATTAELISATCKVMKWKRGPIDEVKKKSYTVFYCNEVFTFKDIETKAGYVSLTDQQKSLGFIASDLDEPAYRNENKYDKSKYFYDWDNYKSEKKSLETDEIYAENYIIYDEHGREITLKEYDNLSAAEQAACDFTDKTGRPVEYIG